MVGAQEFDYVDVSRIERRKLASERDRLHLGALLIANAGETTRRVIYGCYRQDPGTRSTGALINFAGLGSAGSAVRGALARAPE